MSQTNKRTIEKVFFMSDPHFHQTNICRGVSEWKGTRGQSTRDFDTLEEMDAAIVDGINAKVSADDELWCLGDWNFGGKTEIWNFRKQLNCKNIHLIFGNHDDHIENNSILTNAIRKTPYSPIFIDGNPLTYGGLKKGDGEYPNYVYAQELFVSCQHQAQIKAQGISFFLSHYAHRVWDKSHHGRIHLYGHSHASLEDTPWGKSMDVGIDNYFRLFGRYEPFSVEEIMKIMETRVPEIVDHHNSLTN